MTEQNEGNRVQVALRIRPVMKLDKDGDKIVVRACDSSTVAIGSERDMRTYSFDHVLATDQHSVFEAIGRPMVVEAYKGFNVCLFAYGQTGSGKTYSLLGDMNNSELCGITPRLVRQLFDEAQRLVEEDPDLAIKMSLSMIEVYMEKLRDLLVVRQHGQEPEPLEIHEDSNHHVYVKGASVHPVLGFERMMELISSGNANRQMAETKMNETSSRSHAIIQINMLQEYRSTDKRDLKCTISLVDLAGSERQGKADSSGQNFEEAKKINYSLLMLGRTLNSFSERKGGDAFIPLRESKLTRLLSESFGGNSKTWMLATVAPTAYNLVETVSTLDYAKNAMAITNKAHVNKSFDNLEYDALLKLRGSLDAAIGKEVKLLDEYTQKSITLTEEVNRLRLELQQLNQIGLEADVKQSLDEREELVRALQTMLQSKCSSGKQPLPCFSGTCKTYIGNIPINSYDVSTLIVPFYDSAGLPPLMQCHFHVNRNSSGHILVTVEVQEIQNLPDFFTGGVRVSIWFEGQPSSCVTSDAFSVQGGTSIINFQQTFCFGSLTNDLKRYFSSDVLYLRLDGYI